MISSALTVDQVRFRQLGFTDDLPQLRTIRRMATYEASHTTDEEVPASAIKRIGTKIAAIGIVVGVNALIIGGGGMIEAGAHGVFTPGYRQTRSWFVLVLGILAWLALALMVIVLNRRAKRLHP